MKTYLVHILFLLAGLLAACGHPVTYPEELTKADSLLRLDPAQADSASSVLKRFKPRLSGEPESARMFYHLLKTKADDKRYVVHQSDSIMRQVIRYYEKEGNDTLLPEAYYYLGSVYRDMQDAPRAIEAFQRSLDLRSGNDDDLVGRTYNQIGMLLGRQSLYEAALPMLDSAKYYYQQINNQSGIAFALRDIGRMYDMLHERDSSERYYRQSYDNAVAMNERYLMDHLGIELANAYTEWDKLDSAKAVFSRIAGFEKNAIYLQGMGFLKLKENDSDSARYYFQEALSPGKTSQILSLCQVVNHELAKIEAGRGNYRAAWNYDQVSRLWADSIKQVTRTTETGNVHALYNYQHIEKQNRQLLEERAHNRLIVSCTVSALLLFVLAGLLLWIHIIYKRQIMKEQYQRLLTAKEEQYQKSQQRINDNKQEIDRLNQAIERSNAENDKLKILKAQLEKKILEAVNQQIQISQEEQLSKKQQIRKSDIYQWFYTQAQQNTAVLDNDIHWQILYDELDESYNHFTHRLQTLCPDIKKRELRTCCCLKIGFHPTEIAIFFNISVQAISNIRQRLFFKIHGKKGKAEELDIFIAAF